MSESRSNIPVSEDIHDILELDSILVSEGNKGFSVRPDPDVGH